MEIKACLNILGLNQKNNGTSTGKVSFPSSKSIDSISPVDGKKIGSVGETSFQDYNKVIETATSAFKFWRKLPAPKRGEIVRQFGNSLRN